MKMIKPPLVSVLMPVYNSAPYLAEAIESILLQTFRDYEFIIIDDGSTDGSRKIIENYVGKSSIINFISRDNKGISFTRNQLLSAARGKYIAWMDSDDISDKLRLEKQVNYLVNNASCVAVGCMTEFIDQDGLKICSWNTPIMHNEIDQSHLNGKGGGIVFPSSMMVSEMLHKAGGFDNSLTGAEDLDVFLRLAELGEIENLEKVLYIYRQHLESISHASRIKIQQDTQFVVNAARKRRALPHFKCKGELEEGFDSDIYIKWGWWALKGGNVATARKYAKKALLTNLFNWQAWKLMACCIRGH